MQLAGDLVDDERAPADKLVSDIPRTEPPASREVSDPSSGVVLELPNNDLVVRVARYLPPSKLGLSSSTRKFLVHQARLLSTNLGSGLRISRSSCQHRSGSARLGGAGSVIIRA